MGLVVGRGDLVVLGINRCRGYLVAVVTYGRRGYTWLPWLSLVTVVTHGCRGCTVVAHGCRGYTWLPWLSLVAVLTV